VTQDTSRSSRKLSLEPKKGVEQHYSRSSSSDNEGRKKGVWSEPLPSVFSLHPASSDVHDAVMRGACFPPLAASLALQTHARLEMEEELNW
jgi:hypothetical protein